MEHDKIVFEKSELINPNGLWMIQKKLSIELDQTQFALHVQPMKKRYLFCQDRFVNKATSKGYLHKSKSPRSKENDLMSCLNNQVIILRISFRTKTLPLGN